MMGISKKCGLEILECKERKRTMGEMHPKFMEELIREELLRQAAEEGVLTCPTCESKLEVDADKCGICGWKNPLKERMSHVRKTKNNKDPDRVMFHFAAHFPPEYPESQPTLYELFKSGKKTTEYRAATKYWESRLLTKDAQKDYMFLKALERDRIDLTKSLKVKKAWFLHGYPSDNFPRLEADISKLYYLPISKQFKIEVKNLIELVDKEEITEGHGLIDITCEHGSRFVWWWDEGNRWNYPLGRWMIVGEKASDCDCGEPPMPFKTYEQIKEYLATHKDVIQTIE